MVITIPVGQRRDAQDASYKKKEHLIDNTFVKPQAAAHLNNGSATFDDSAAATPDAPKITSRRGQAFFDKHSSKLVTLQAESFGQLGAGGCKLAEQLATSIVGGLGGGASDQKGKRVQGALCPPTSDYGRDLPCYRVSCPPPDGGVSSALE